MAAAQHELDDALGRIEEAILPNIALMLETMVDAADHARRGSDAATCAVELRMLALQLESVSRQMQAIVPDRR